MEKMKKYTGVIAVALLIIVLITLFVFVGTVKNENSHYLIESILISSIALVGIFVIALLGLAALSSKKDDPHALGLPAGSVRAIIAISITVLFILIALYFFQVVDVYPPDSPKVELAKSILTILGTLVVAVSSFYFSAKATQQGIDAATKAFQGNNEGSGNLEEAIIDAIAKNEKDWKKKYKIEEAKIGKKQSEGNQLEIKCIVFWVKKKEVPTDKSKEIPKLVTHTYKGKVYEIVTDIKEKQNGLKEADLDTIEKLIKEHKDIWLERFKAESVIATLKVTEGETIKVPCAQFSVTKKKDQTKTQSEQIPNPLVIKGFEVITDVIEEEIPSQDKGSIQPGDGIYREGSSDSGTIGLKVYKEDNMGNKTDYLLSCYHVLCSTELYSDNPVTKFDSNVSNKSIISEKTGTKIGEVVDGLFNDTIDAALCLIENGVDVNAALKENPYSPSSGIREITSSEVESQISVYTYGKISGDLPGKIIAKSVSRYFSFEGRLYPFVDVIKTSKISEKGDSGAMVTDRKGRVIGIVFASNSQFSYVIPISTIQYKLKFQIYYV